MIWEILPTLERLISEIKVYAKRYKHDFGVALPS